MGLGPQLADLNGDGRSDLFTAAYTGIVSWMPGEDGGGFGPARPLLRVDGEPVGLGKVYDEVESTFRTRAAGRYGRAKCVSAAPVDWDGDGDVDLVLGDADGLVLLCRNGGTAKEPAFAAEAEPIRAGRKSLWVEPGYAMIATGDLDGDGLFDLTVGARDGSVTHWRNVGERGAPAFSPPTILLDPSPPEPDRDTPGQNASPHVADLDGDGRAELLVGDRRRNEGDATTHGWVWVIEVEYDAGEPEDGSDGGR